MSAQITDSTHVAFYCSTVGLAFGPVFDSQDDAEDFLERLNRIDGRDVRLLSQVELARHFKAWQDERASWEPSDREMFGAGAA